MTWRAIPRWLRAFVAILMFQIIAIPIVSWLLDLNEGLQTPSWVALLMTSAFIAAALEYHWRSKEA